MYLVIINTARAYMVSSERNMLLRLKDSTVAKLATAEQSTRFIWLTKMA